MKDLDKSVIERWKKGDKEAFAEIVRFYMNDAYLTALAFVGNREDARDLSQDAFIKVFKARKSFDASKPFYPWFYRILKNHCINYSKRFLRKTEDIYFEGHPGSERFACKSPNPLEKLSSDERKKILRAAIGRLSIDHREIIILKNFEGYSYKQIGDILGIPIGTVMSRLYYARRMLREIIMEMENKGFQDEKSVLTEGNPSPGEVV